MINVKNNFPAKGNAYILFGFEAIQARPNLDPYTSMLRTNDETSQVFTSDVHIKHHVRRGLKAEAAVKGLPHAEYMVFYEKEDEAGKPCDFGSRLKMIRSAFGIDKNSEDKRDALSHTLDLPLFGYVHAIKNENLNVANSVNTLFRPVTFHRCDIYPLGRNNAFPTLGKDQQVKESAGSATVDSLEYGFFLALWEINLNMLRVNAQNSKIVDWQTEGAAKWISLLVNGMWRAYTTDRYPSFTQRSQFAQFLLGWTPAPEAELSYANPADLYAELEEKRITTHAGAVDALKKILPDFLSGWQCSPDNVFAVKKAHNFDCPLPGDAQ